MGDLNGLMRALRDEIALAGEEGATVQAVLAAIDHFYQNKAKQRHGNQADISLQNVDRAFQARIWSWLTKDHLVSIGGSKEGNSLTLNELEARNLESEPLRIFTTEQQTWITLTGNEKDTRKIPNSSFKLLSVIAAHRETGITQPELVRITGQDKRSVPQRTQKLAEAGHIKKIPVLANGANTSLLVHSKFSAQFAGLSADTQANGSTNTESHGVLLGRNRHVKAEKEIRTTIKLLQDSQNHLMIWDDIRAKCQVEDPIVSRYLAGGIRKLEELGVIARVRAATSTVQNTKTPHLYRCVQLLRTPTEEDWRLLFQLSKQEQDKLIEPVSVQDIQDELYDTGSTNWFEINSLVAGNESSNNTEDVFVPLWNPDRLLTHTIHSALLEAGTTGLSTKDLKRIITGPFYARPIDRFLDRCVRSWQRSQPLHLRHLAIIRDSAQLGKITCYVHFVHDAFGVKVNNGETFWEAVQSLPEPSHANAVDEYGFEILSSSMFAGNKNELTLKKALEAAENGDQSVCAPGMNRKPKGASKKWQRRAVHNSRKASTRGIQQGQENITPIVPLGRPRKYPNVNDLADFSKMSSTQIKNAVTSQKRAQEYLRKKAHKEVELHISRGMSKDEAEETVIAELGLTPESYMKNTITEPKELKTRTQDRSLKRKRGQMIPNYFPSVLAHTFPLHGYEGFLLKPLEHPNNKRTKLSTTGIGYLPSVLAHNLPVLSSHAHSRIKQTSMISKSKRKGHASTSRKIPVSNSGQNSDGLLLSAPLSLPSVHEKSNDSELASSINETIKTMQLRTTDYGSDSWVIPDKSDKSQQPNEIYNEGQDEIPQTDDIAHHCEAQSSSARDDLTMAPCLKRKASANEPAELTAKKQCNMSVAESGFVDTQQTVNEIEHNNSDRDSVAPAMSPLHGPDMVVDQDITESNVINPRLHTPTNKLLPFITNQQISPSIDKENPLPTGTETTSPVKKRASRKRMAPFGGTVAAMRRLIILDIVRNCDGVFPGDAELVYPFITAYVRKFPDAKPDPRTIKLAKTTLIGEGQLKQVCFTYKAPTGTIHTKTIITLPEVLEASEQVKELQDAIIKAHPSQYFPPGTDIRADLMPKSASLDTDGRVSKKGTYIKDLPVVSAVVVPQHEMGSRSQSQQRDSVASADSADLPQTQTAKSTPSKPKQRRALNQDNTGNEEHSPGGYPNQEQFVEIQSTRKRANDSGSHDEMARKKPRRSKLDLQIQDQPTETVFKTPMQLQTPETSTESQSTTSPSTGESSFQVQLRHEVLTDQALTDQALTNQILADQALADQALADQALADQALADQVLTDQALANQILADQALADQALAIQTPAIKAPATRAPAIKAPATQATTIQAPTIQAPTIQAPTIQAPTIQAPTIQAPTIQVPQVQVPTMQAPGIYVPTAGSRNYPPLEVQYGATITSGVQSPYIPTPVRLTQSPYLGSAPSNPFSLPADTERNELRSPAKKSGDMFVHYPFPTENFISVPVRNNPVGRKRIEKPRPEGLLKRKAKSSGQQSLDQSTLEGNRGELQQTKARRNRTTAPKPSALELHEKRQEKTPGIRYSKSSQTQARQIEFRRERHEWKPENDRKLLIATLFSHIAYGGVREENHWAIVSKMLSNKYDSDLCRRRWTAVRTKYRGDLEIIYLELRSALLDSYEKGKIPKLDYAHILENDWEGIMTWAMDKIENPTSEDVELPSSREAFESTFLIQEFPPRDGLEFFENKRIASIPARHSVLNAGARVFTKKPKILATELEIAKSYVLANVLTPENAYSTEKAREKLLKFPEKTIEQAISCLLADKTISQTNRGRAAPGRTYDISRFYLKAMQWKLSVAHFKYAAAFKDILDKKLETDRRMQYKQAFGNGEMITLINLLADGMLELDGKDIPNKKFGLATEGYKTRNIDKRAWNFAVHMKPNEDYIKGHPCRPLPQPPTQCYNQSATDTNLSPNPMWVDINGEVLPIIWDLAVAAVVTILVINTGSNAENIAQMVQPCVASFEVQLIMQWLVDAGAAKWKDERHDCLDLKTWWWSVITTPITKNANAEEATMIAGQPMQH